MMRIHSGIPFTALAVVMFALGAPVAHAQGKIVCWKDTSGKTVGCGDKVPPEYAGGATKELDKQGNVRNTRESADEIAKRKAQESEQAQAKAAESKRLSDQKRQDMALINTFSDVKEVDLKRDRELQALDHAITQQKAALKNADERVAETRNRSQSFEKDKKPVPPAVKEDFARAEREKARIEADIASKAKAKADTAVKYAEFRKRLLELKGPAAAAPAAPATAAAPAKK